MMRKFIWFLILLAVLVGCHKEVKSYQPSAFEQHMQIVTQRNQQTAIENKQRHELLVSAEAQRKQESIRMDLEAQRAQEALTRSKLLATKTHQGADESLKEATSYKGDCPFCTENGKRETKGMSRACFHYFKHYPPKEEP